MQEKNNDMKILHVVGNDFKPGNGIFAVVKNLMVNLQSQAISNELLLLKKPETEYISYTFYEKEKFDINLKEHRFDIVLFHGLFFKAFPEIAKKLKVCDIPYCVKPHASLMKNSWKKSFLKKFIAYVLFLRPFLKGAKSIFFINGEEQGNSFYSDKGVIDPNIVETVSIGDFPKDSNNEIRFLYLSRIDFKHKGLKYLIEGISQYIKQYGGENVFFDIYGPGTTSETTRLQQEISGLSNVSYLGPVYGQEKESVFLKSDIFMLTSQYEGFPTVVVEALQFGLPVVISAGTNCRFLNKYDVAWECELNKQSIADALHNAVVNYKKNRYEVKNLCQKVVSELFSLDKTLDQNITNVKEVIHKHMNATGANA